MQDPPNLAHASVVGTSPQLKSLSAIGLAVLTLLAMGPFFIGTLVFPPWLEMDVLRQRVLITTRLIEVKSSKFVGFDYVFSNEKWHADRTPDSMVSGATFRSHEFAIHKPILIFEWMGILTIGILGYLFLYRKWLLNKRAG